MRFSALKNIVAELSRFVAGAVVKKVTQARPGVYLLLKKGKEDHFLLLCPDRSDPRIHLVSHKPITGDLPVHGFTLYLRSRLPGAVLSRVGIVNEDRIVELLLARGGEEFRLVMELVGVKTNLMLLDSAGVVTSTYYGAGGLESDRILLPGTVYEPPAKKGFIPDDDPGAPPPAGLDQNRQIEKFYAAKDGERALSARRTDLTRIVRKQLIKARRRKESLFRDLSSAEQADAYRKAGDLILANLTHLARGAEEALLTGYDGASTTVKLDPKRSPGQNAEQYFKKYKKARSGRLVIGERLQRTKDEEEYLETLLADIAGAETPERLDELDQRITESVSAGSGQGKKGREKERKDAVKIPAFRKIMFQGWEIIVGKSAAGNDYVTTKIAKKSDLWLHAEGMPGSHVLIRNPSGAEIPPEVLIKAASCAAYYSKGRGSAKVAVAYTRAGNVRKPKGARPGSVILSERKSLVAPPEDLQEITK